MNSPYDVDSDWVVQFNDFGLWIVGPEVDGIVNILGMGRTKEEAFKMAMRSKEK